jgi:hypothetical protein
VNSVLLVLRCIGQSPLQVKETTSEEGARYFRDMAVQKMTKQGIS